MPRAREDARRSVAPPVGLQLSRPPLGRRGDTARGARDHTAGRRRPAGAAAVLQCGTARAGRRCAAARRHSSLWARLSPSHWRHTVGHSPRGARRPPAPPRSAQTRRSTASRPAPPSERAPPLACGLSDQAAGTQGRSTGARDTHSPAARQRLAAAGRWHRPRPGRRPRPARRPLKAARRYALRARDGGRGTWARSAAWRRPVPGAVRGARRRALLQPGGGRLQPFSRPRRANPCRAGHSHSQAHRGTLTHVHGRAAPRAGRDPAQGTGRPRNTSLHRHRASAITQHTSRGQRSNKTL